ncbi:MAG: hypothetical protein Q9M92_13120 [Enterobacterales bacterium]|nr:hypothetical protein [Enterobacterales bacterium]
MQKLDLYAVSVIPPAPEDTIVTVASAVDKSINEREIASADP